MSQLQKYAWFNLVVFTVTTVVYLALVPVMGWGTATAAFGLCGFMGFGAFILRKNRPGKVVWDERENLIWKRSGRIAFGAFWGLFVLACMVPWFILGPKATISVNVLPDFVGGGFLTILVIQSLAIIILYRREVSNDGE
jgi:hypothetical protein